MRKKRFKCAALAFSFLLALFPLQVSAAGTQKVKELTFTVSEMEEAKKQAEKAFEKIFKEQGNEYKLSDIQYEVIHTEYLDKKEKRVELKEKPKEKLIEDGMEYTLKTSEKSEKVVAERTEQEVSAYDDYDHAVTAADVPGSKTVTATNHVTGAEEQVNCQFTGISNAGTVTVENTMTITFAEYDSAYFEWNGNYIARNDEIPPLAGYEDSLLASVGAEEGSVITDYHWSGDPYTADGVVCRDAEALIQRQVAVYRANYAGYIVTPEKKETVYQAVYEAPDKDGKKEVAVKAVAAYAEVKKSYVPYIIAAGAGLAVAAGLIAWILIILAKKKNKNRKSEEEK